MTDVKQEKEKEKVESNGEKLEFNGKVKPLVTHVDAGSEVKQNHLFFGNNNFYIFFRLYQLLYDRMYKAMQLASNQKEKWGAPSGSTAKSAAPSPNREEEESKKKDRFQHFINTLHSFIVGSLDQVKYEDELRETFGISSSYILFTLDKLILQLVKQVQLILSDETCTKLLSLYTYEASRATGFITQTYLANVMEVLGEERCFKFEFEQAPRFHEFTIQLLDSNQPRYMELSVNKDKWNNYVENYVHGDSNQIDVRKHHIFLLRNKKKNLAKKDKEKNRRYRYP